MRDAVKMVRSFDWGSSERCSEMVRIFDWDPTEGCGEKERRKIVGTLRKGVGLD